MANKELNEKNDCEKILQNNWRLWDVGWIEFFYSLFYRLASYEQIKKGTVEAKTESK